ncbi:hypothetical protein MMC31_006934 [Peltigera leucophlebia]|nr:hypothetical protein [Peltigera leucophlebia]
MILLLMVLYPYSSGSSASWALASNPTRALMNTVNLAPPQVTPGPEIGSKGIFARANIATCGYISGNAASPLTCPESYMCSSTVLYAGAGWGCCDQIQCQGNYNVCVDYGGNLCPNFESQLCKNIYTSILSCSSDAPACVTYARSKSLGDLRTDYSLGCGKSAGTILALISTTAGGGKASKPTSTAGGTTNSTPNAAVTQSADGASSSNAPGPSTGSTTTGSSKGSSNKKLSTGEIAAIVIPIVAIIAAFIIGWWKRHQVTWLLTCGAFGYKHSERPLREEGHRPYATPLGPMPSHANYGPIKMQPDPPPIYTAQRPFLHPNQSQHGALPPRNTPSPYQNFQASQPFLPRQPQNQPGPAAQGWITYDGIR